MKNDPILASLAKLDDAGPDALSKALASKSNLVAAKAARIAGTALHAQLAPDLAAAFERFLGKTQDKGCAALVAIGRALVQLDYDEPEPFRRGMKHVQMEGTWGGSQDVAAELRAVCAVGLANTRDPNKLRDLVELLADPEWQARAGAARAIAAVGSDAAALLLRYKTLLGDPEPEVLTDTLTGLLELDGAAALPLARSLTNSQAPEIREAAILALGTSRRADAIELLKDKFDSTPDRDTKKCILLALAGSRTEPAREFLESLVRAGDEPIAGLAQSAMESCGLTRSSMS